VKWHTSIAAVILDRGIELETRGRHLFARCPFHRPDNTPSFVVTEAKGLFHCFGCGVAGDVIGFVMRYDRLSFPEAVKKLAARAQILLEEQRSAARHGEDLCGRTEPWRR